MDHEQRQSRVRTALRQKEIPFLLVALFTVIFSWPFLAFENLGSPIGVYSWMYLAWASLIAILFVVSQAAD